MKIENIEILRNSKILISGGTGFIGSNFISLLSKLNKEFNLNLKVYSLSLNSIDSNDFVTYIACNITQKIEDLGFSPDYIIHLASNTHPAAYENDPVGTILTNVLGCNNLFEFAIEHRIKKFILASSVEIYGNGLTKTISEDDFGSININNYRSGYNEAKRVCESLCHSYLKQYNIPFSIVRFARVYGYDTKRDSKVMSYMINCALKHEDIILNSDGNQIYSYCYIKDAINGLLTVLLNGKIGEAYNVSSKLELLSLNDIGKIICDLSGVNLIHHISVNEAASKATFAQLDISKIKGIGFEPQYSLKDGIKETIEKYQNF